MNKSIETNTDTMNKFPYRFDIFPENYHHGRYQGFEEINY